MNRRDAMAVAAGSLATLAGVDKLPAGETKPTNRVVLRFNARGQLLRESIQAADNSPLARQRNSRYGAEIMVPVYCDHLLCADGNAFRGDVGLCFENYEDGVIVCQISILPTSIIVSTVDATSVRVEDDGGSEGGEGEEIREVNAERKAGHLLVGPRKPAGFMTEALSADEIESLLKHRAITQVASEWHCPEYAPAPGISIKKIRKIRDLCLCEQDYKSLLEAKEVMMNDLRDKETEVREAHEKLVGFLAKV